MTQPEFVPLVVCYPPGAGGNFLASAFDNLLFGKKFTIDAQGTCHDNAVITVPHYVPHDNIPGMQNEFTAFGSIPWPQTPRFVAAGHVRNLVALQSLRYDLWFVKITFDCENPQHIDFLTEILMRKVPMQRGWQHCYREVREPHWPQTLEEFLTRPDSQALYRQQTQWSLKNWFWVENSHTRARTLELDLVDIFLGIPGDRLSQWFDDVDLLNDLFRLSRSYQLINQRLYPDLIKLLE